MADDQRTNRAPPHDDQAEDAVLGASLLSLEAVEVARAIIGNPADFYRPSNGHVWTATLNVLATGAKPDVVTVGAELRRRDLLDDIGGTARLFDLITTSPGTGNTVGYARVVRDAAIARHVIGEANRIIEEGYARPADMGAFVARSQERLLNLNGHTPEGLGHNLRIADVAALIAGGVPKVDPDFFTRTDGQCLLYAGRMHMLQAEPAAGKSFLALHAAKEVLGIGGAVVYIDFEDTEEGIVGRLLAVGAAGPHIAERFGYIAQDGPMGPAEMRALLTELERLNPDLIVIDGVAEALVREGFDENSAGDFVRWVEMMPRPLARTGAAVLMLDHVKKDSPGRWARGSGAKLGALDGVAYTVRVVEGFSRSSAGRVKLTVAKDRPGGVGAPGEVVADVTITPHAGGERVAIVIGPHVTPTGKDGAFEPTHAMQRVSEVLEAQEHPMPRADIIAAIGPRFTTATITQALNRLIHLGHARQSGHANRGVVAFVRAYKAPTDTPAAPVPQPPEPPLEMF